MLRQLGFLLVWTAGGAALKKLNGPDFLKLGGCFVAGTAVHLSASPVAVSELELAYAATASESFSYDLGFAWEEPSAESALVVPIEQVPLGSRIATKNPEAFGAENPIPDAHESTWRLLSAEIEREDGARVEVELLRPLAWIEEQGFTTGARIYLRLEELNVAGWATIRSVDPCPSLSDGHGNLVTGRFVTRGATNLVEATFSDGTVLNGTSIHPVWSLDRMDWVPLGELAIGEQVYSNDGPLHLVARTGHNQPTDVYNIEVDCEHVYQVGDAGILVHNNCFRALDDEDLARYVAGQRILPKGTGGTIIDHIRGGNNATTKYISASMTRNGTARYNSGFGVIEIDVKRLLQTGSGIVDHKSVLQAAKRLGDTRIRENVIAAKEILITGGIDPSAIIRLLT